MFSVTAQMCTWASVSPGISVAPLQSSVVTGPDAVPTEIHIVASRSKGAKQVVRDVQSLAMATYDIDIDHRIVSVVQFDDGIDGLIEGQRLPAVITLPESQPQQPSSNALRP